MEMGRQAWPWAWRKTGDDIKALAVVARRNSWVGHDMGVNRVQTPIPLLALMGNHDGLSQEIVENRHDLPGEEHGDPSARPQGAKPASGIDKEGEVQPFMGAGSGCCRPPPGAEGAKPHAIQPVPVPEPLRSQAIGLHQTLTERVCRGQKSKGAITRHRVGTTTVRHPYSMQPGLAIYPVFHAAPGLGQLFIERLDEIGDIDIAEGAVLLLDDDPGK